MAEYGPRSQGAIFEERNKKSEKGPDFTGSFDFTREFIEALRDAPRDDRGNVKVRVAGWNKRGPSKDYISCQLELSKSREEHGDSGRRDSRGNDRRDDRRDDRNSYDQRDDRDRRDGRRDDRDDVRDRDRRRDELDEEIPF